MEDGTLTHGMKLMPNSLRGKTVMGMSTQGAVVMLKSLAFSSEALLAHEGLSSAFFGEASEGARVHARCLERPSK